MREGDPQRKPLMSFINKKRKILSCLELIYSPSRARDVQLGIEKLCLRYGLRRKRAEMNLSERDSLLITYGDSISDKNSKT